MSKTRLMAGVLAFGMIASTANRLRAQEAGMDEMWGEQSPQEQSASDRGELFRNGKYAMFIHWGIYSNIANRYKDKTYYGIGEWIMNSNMAGIPPAEYMTLAQDFNPSEFDADAVARLAKESGMKYIVITAKHHDGFAMYDSEACDFNIVDATPYARDPMRDLAAACAKHGIGLGFYYSHNQDWTYPGGSGGPRTTADGTQVGFDYYYKNKCLPQVREITSKYGPIALVWFDTPGGIPKQYVQELVAVVRENQPGALVSGRAGYGLGDYQTLGDMEVPKRNVEGLWETVDTTNDSWGYAWYDSNWKTPRQILERLIACAARGGTYMLNIGPRGDGSVPEAAAESLRRAGEWLKRYPQVVYGSSPSPWGRALPWGDVTVDGRSLYLSIFELPASGVINIPGLQTEIEKALLLGPDGAEHELDFEHNSKWTTVKLPAEIEEKHIPVVELRLADNPQVEPFWGVDPALETDLHTEFATVTGAARGKQQWMEKFGEWKHTMRVHNWKPEGKASWQVEFLESGYYQIDLSYSGSGRLVWKVELEGVDSTQNQQNSSHNYQRFPIGWLRVPAPGRYTLSVALVDGDRGKSSLQSAHIQPAMLDE
jgi:alpha-L-fucosidase